jgi:hypothetical protein
LGLNADERRAPIRSVLGKRISCFSDKKNHLGRRRAGIDAQIGFAFIMGKIAISNIATLCAFNESAIFRFIFEEGFALSLN